MNCFDDLARHLQHNRVTRRQALWLLGSGTLSAAGVLSGCATSPVSGKSILVGMSESQEKQIDKQIAPHQFSQDLGPVQDGELNRYVSNLGGNLDKLTHRPNMPYSYRVLNANYMNAYTFPGGAMGVTRGLLVELQNEAELAALWGHELGHVNARHAAQKQGESLVAQVAVGALNIASKDSRWAGLIAIGSQIGASALLSSYSRDNEREADALGQEYMVRAGYPASGMATLHQHLIDQEKEAPSLLQTMFSTHPMSQERKNNAQQLAETRYASSRNASPQRERFMDQTARLRQLKPTIQDCAQGESALATKKFLQAEDRLRSALKRTPQDYAANVVMAQCLMAQGRRQEALRYAEAARTIYPQEARAHKVAGVLALELRDPGRAYQYLDQHDRLLPGNPEITFLKGISLEGMGDRRGAAQHYSAFLRHNQSGQAAQYAQSRLKSWGYLR